jgi:RNA polymerase sigma-70 factor, ECF subfamily
MVRAAASSFAQVDMEVESSPAAAPALAHPLLRCVDGNHAAWRQLHRHYYPVAAAFLRKLGVQERDLDDACQEVFLQMFRYLPSFRGEADPKTWLYRLCITQARRARLRHKVTSALEHMLAFLPRDSLVSTPSFSEPAAQRRIEAALAALSDKERSAFVLFEMEGMGGKEICAILECTEATLWRRLHYARQVFRQALVETEVAP